jgi:REP element-mobilizing transposase RayT
MNLFGRIESRKMVLSQLGTLGQDLWKTQPLYFPTMILDEFIVMPNHMHMIIALGNASSDPKPLSVPRAMQAFKSVSTIEARKDGVLDAKRIWQPGYHDHIVRGPQSLDRIREYIATNPDQWELDRENDKRTGLSGFY